MKINFFIFIFFISNIYAVDAVLNISKKVKIEKFYEIQLASFLNLNDAKNLYFKLPKDIKIKSNIYKLNKYYALRYGNASKSREILTKDLKRVRKLIKSAYIVKIDSNTLNKRIEFKSNKINKKIYKIKDNYDYVRVMAEANNLKNSNLLFESIKRYESLFKYNPKNLLISSNLFYLYGKTKSWQRVSKELYNLNNRQSLLYAYGVGAIESNDKNLEKNLKPFLYEDYNGYLNLILGVSKEKEGWSYQAYEYYKNAYLQNSYDEYLIYAYARACELVELYDLAKNLYKQLSQKVDIEKSIKDNSYLRYIELNSIIR